jgi:starch synthase
MTDAVTDYTVEPRKKIALVAHNNLNDQPPHVLMVAAECRGLAKAGGLGDVVRDLSKALTRLGTPVSIVMPCYDQIAHSSRPIAGFPVQFGSRDDWPVKVFTRELDGVTIYLLRSQKFFGGRYGTLYVDSERLERGAFEDDAMRFAFFSAATLEFIRQYPGLSDVNVLHCHDWHTGALLVLLKHDRRYQRLAKSLRTLFTIHNLDYQGTRPFELAGERELLSFSDWFPALYRRLKRTGALTALSDAHAPIPCFNPMRAAINLAGSVNTVSPRYATEIIRPDDPARNFIGGRGLEDDLRRAGKIYGILNGLDYELYDSSRLLPAFDVDLKDWPRIRHQHKINLLEQLSVHLQDIADRSGRDFKNRDSVLNKLTAFRAHDWYKKPLVVAVTRAVRQKVNILLEPLDKSGTVLQHLLQRDIFLIVLGTGELEEQLEEINRYPNGLFICTFDAQLADRLYVGGDLFLMPSDFEPCGISQMIAMRYGCLPVVPNLGGLSDTVQTRKTGFVYRGVNRQAARRGLIRTLDQALWCYTHEHDTWLAMQARAMSARFEWTAAAEKYLELYSKPIG